jgi:amino acid adenylation domain-containing protein
MSVEDILVKLDRIGVDVRVEDQQLKIRAPKGVLTSELREEISTNRDLVILQINLRDALDRKAPALVAQARPEPLPLSYAQERLWLLEQIGGLGSAYNLTARARLYGRFDDQAFELALSEVVNRHESLRTRFTDVDGGPVQVIDPPGLLVLQVEDLDYLAGDERASAARRRIRALAAEPFDLERGPLFRAHLLRLSEEEHMAVLVMHHIVSDGWSMRVLIQELSALYAAFCEGRPSPLGALPVQYADYALWQRQWLQGDVLAEQVGYWKDRLAGAPVALELPTDRVRPAVQSYRGAAYNFALSPELTAGLYKLARVEGATLFMILLAAFQVLLSRWSGQTDVVVGTPIAGRTHRELESLIGYFLNTLALRTDLSGDPSFHELVGQVKETALGAYAHQELPFEKLVEELQPVRDLSRQPVFQVLLVLQNVPQATQPLPGLQLSRKGGGGGSAKLDLSLYVFEREGRLDGHFEYATDLFDRSTIERLAGHLRILLEGIVADPDARIGELPLLDEAERRRVLVEWNATAADYPKEKCVHELLAAQAARTPDAVALVYEEQQISYGELERRTNQLAHYLRELGVGPDVIVGLCIERSLEMIAGLLGILKAGGAYLPLDPGYPAERLAYMVSDAGAPVVLTQAAVADRLPGGAQRVVVLDGSAEAIAAQPLSAPVSGAGPDNLAYVIYTSGSTGQPKGAMGTHRALVNRLQWEDGAGAGEIYAQKSTLNVIDALWEVFMPLIHGGRVAVVEAAASKDPRLLAAALGRHGVTRVMLVPSLLQALIESHAVVTDDLAGLQYLMSSGEALRPELVRAAARLLPRARIVNVYGTSEFWDAAGCDAQPEFEDVRIPIGRPLTNMRLYVLNGAFEPVPVGVGGELYIGGVGLARGYAGRANLTAARFVPSPFGTGERLYRSGDLGRWRSDGRLEFLGRADGQVKLRGHRVEPGEIEARLVEHAAVHQAVVMAREDVPGDQRLVAYVVAADAAALGAGELRAHLKRSLPEYMVPSAFVLLDGLPLTPNGKIDRRALPVPEAGAVIRGDYVAPRTPVEEVLAGIWTEVLKLDRVGVQDNFFTLGGHSLLAMRVVARVREALAVELPLRALFDAPTVGELAGRVETAQREGLGLVAPALEVQARGADLPLSYAQERLWVLEQLEDAGSAYNIAGVVRLSGALDVAALERSFAALVDRHENLRTRFEEVAGRPVQVIDGPGDFRLAKEDLSGLGEDEGATAASRRAAEIKAEPFDLARGPLLRASLLKLSAEEYVVVAVMHHIVSDGWSMRLLVHELGALYAAFCANRPSPLGGLPVQYADYALWQRGWLQGEVLAKQIAYWRRHLDGAPAALELPTDRVRPAVQSFRGAAHGFALPAELTRGLSELARREGATPFLVLLAAFQVLLSRWSGQDDVVVGTPVAGRTHREVEGLIGFFVNMLALRTKLSGDPSFRELLGQVRETALGAYAHQDLPFEKLVEELQPVRDLSRRPIFQVMINSFRDETLSSLEETPSSLTLPQLKVSALSSGEVSARFELMLRLRESAHNVMCRFEYATDLFDGATMERLAGQFRNLLEAIVVRPEAAVSELDVLGQAERSQLQEWSTTVDHLSDKYDLVAEDTLSQSIERPLSSMRTYVLDRWLGLAPVGVFGELYIGGIERSGEVGTAALTAERFVPNPFGDGERLYRTGDVARWRAEGVLDWGSPPAVEAGPEDDPAAVAYEAPRTPLEEVIAGIWLEMLGVERIGIHDNFFTLGGHSLLGTRVIARLRDAFQLELPLRVLFEAPTVGELAGRVELAQRINERAAQRSLSMSSESDDWEELTM